MGKMDINADRQATDFKETLDRYEWMPFDSILLDFMPAWHRLLMQQPESLISFKEISQTFSIDIQRAAWNKFLLGKIGAFNLLTNKVAKPLFQSNPSIDHFDYIKGDFPLQFEGDLLFENIPERIAEVGEFNYYPRWRESPPCWTFKLHHHIRNEASILSPQENVRVFSVGYKRVGTSTIPKKILFYLGRGDGDQIILSALCEGRFYRAMNKELLTITESFIRGNFQSEIPNRHVLNEELAFYTASIVGRLPSVAAVPDEHRLSQEGARDQINRLMSNLLFLLKEIKSIDIKTPLLPLHNGSDFTTGETNNCTTEQEGMAEKCVDSTESSVFSDVLPIQYIFRQREMGGWDIQFANEKIEIPKSRGCIFIHKILEYQEGYTSFELEDKFDPQKSSIEDVPTAFTKDAFYHSSKFRNKHTNADKKKRLQDYNEGIKELMEEMEEINENLESLQIDPEEACENRQRLAEIKKLLSLSKEEAANIALDREGGGFFRQAKTAKG